MKHCLTFYGHSMPGDRLNQTCKVCEINFLSVSQYFNPWVGIFSYMWQMDPSPPSANWPKFPLLDQVPTLCPHKNPNPEPPPPPPKPPPRGLYRYIYEGGLLLHKKWLFHASFVIHNNCFELFSSVHSLFPEIFSLNLTSPFAVN